MDGVAEVRDRGPAIVEDEQSFTLTAVALPDLAVALPDLAVVPELKRKDKNTLAKYKRQTILVITITK